MTQHFLLSAQARSLSLKEIYKAGEDAAYKTFCSIRWVETDGGPVCPRCGCLEAYSITTRRKFKCKACHHQFSVTSGTIFASRKMDFTDLLAAICIFVNAVKGISALQMSRDLDCQYKTAFVLSHKLREAMALETKGMKLDGVVEIDGCHVGGHIRPANFAEERIDRRLARHQTGKRRVVVALRQRQGRTLPFVAKFESDGVDIAARVLKEQTIIFADEAAHWDRLAVAYPMGRINHRDAYSDQGAHTNNVESYFSRLRRMVTGQHHHVSPGYLHQYAGEAAWREDHRREANGELAGRALTLAMASGVSRNWKGYWQRAAA
ncbi:IS1595 family transposase [Euryhalocaulis caribicus]|uniref:IS1595 family transposase n=1 Tax=Euryhalocaulis caribicus TaxID=1161401 RepID=UPI00039A624B|nr:IS1595 family transposase [Euryhalocaulis caribicus]